MPTLQGSTNIRFCHIFPKILGRTGGALARGAPFGSVTGSFIFEFSINVFTKFFEFNAKKYYVSKRLFELATSFVRDQDATTAQARHIGEARSSN